MMGKTTSSEKTTISSTSAARATIIGSASPRRSAELCLVSLCAPDCGEGLPALRARVARLERSVASGIPVAAPTSAPAPAPIPEPVIKQDEPPVSEPPISEHDDYERPPLPDDDYAPPEDTPPVRRAPPPATAPVADGGLWEQLLPRLEGKLETYIYALLLPSSQTTGAFSGATLTIHVTNPFAQTSLERAEVKSVIQRIASELCGHDISVNIIEQAAERKPDEAKLAGLSRFANFKED